MNKNTYISLITFVTAFSLTLFWLNYQSNQKTTNLPSNQPQNTKQSPLTTKCGIESCHGLDITCGPNVPDVCNMMYTIGDICRQYASCQITNNKCQLVENTAFTTCKNCVQKCQQEHSNDPVQMSQCEGQCKR